jgi:hypothetical protein
MAKMIQAYQRYRPRVQTGKLVGEQQIAEFIAKHTGLHVYEVQMVLGELQDATIHFVRQGHGVKVAGLVNLWPTISSTGKLSLGRRFDDTLLEALNDLGAFGGRIRNYERREWTPEDYRTAWETEFPDDPIED